MYSRLQPPPALPLSRSCILAGARARLAAPIFSLIYRPRRAPQLFILPRWPSGRPLPARDTSNLCPYPPLSRANGKFCPYGSLPPAVSSCSSLFFPSPRVFELLAASLALPSSFLPLPLFILDPSCICIRICAIPLLIRVRACARFSRNYFYPRL